MRRVIMTGVWIMIAATVSTVVAIPLGMGTVSGVAFAAGMVLAWLAGTAMLGIWVTRFIRSKWIGS
jgi:hypothetical protein